MTCSLLEMKRFGWGFVNVNEGNGVISLEYHVLNAGLGGLFLKY